RSITPFYSACLSSLLLLSPPPATPNLHTLSLHDALPILRAADRHGGPAGPLQRELRAPARSPPNQPVEWRIPLRDHDHVFLKGQDRKSTRLNSSHRTISYAVFCLKKKKSNKHNSDAAHFN